MSADFQYCILGGGAVGLAIAYQLSQHSSVLLLEQHDLFGSETSSRNSEVIHAGLYYPAGSLKEQLCLRGKELLYDFCQRFDIPHQKIGKLIVAQQANDPKLAELEAKAHSLNIPIRRLNKAELEKTEPEVRATEALLSPSTGIIDSHSYMQALAQQAERQGALLMLNSRFIRSEQQSEYQSVNIETSDGEYQLTVNKLINCGGLYAQQIAQQSQLDPELIPPLYPCRGHYFSYQGKNPFQHLIYPLPEANLTGLGIHATIDLGGQLRFGPDTQYLASGELHYQVDEQLREKFAAAIQRYYPQLSADQLQPDYAGIRPKLHQQHETTADFIIQPDPQGHALHLFGIESPGLTASLAIAEYVVKWARS